MAKRMRKREKRDSSSKHIFNDFLSYNKKFLFLFFFLDSKIVIVHKSLQNDALFDKTLREREREREREKSKKDKQEKNKNNL